VLLAAFAAAALAADASIVEVVMNKPPSVVAAPAAPDAIAGFVVLRGAGLPPLLPETVDVRQPLTLEAAFACRTRERVSLSATVDWGDSTVGPAVARLDRTAPAWLKAPASLAGLALEQAQQGALTAAHAYAAAEMYTVTVTLNVVRASDGRSTSFTRSHRLRVRDPALAEQPWRFDIGPLTTTCADGQPCNFPLALDARMEAHAGFRFGSSWRAGQTARWDWGDGTSGAGTVSATGGAGRASGFHSYAKGGRFKVTLTVAARHNDGTPEARTQTIDLVAADVGIDALTPPPGALPAGLPADFQATYRYADVARKRRATWTWGDGPSAAGELSERDGVGTVSGRHTFAKAGVYKVELTIADGLAEVASAIEVTVSSPGRVAASGTIPCPAGVFVADRKRAGTAHLELHARHDGAAPDGSFRLSGPAFEFVAERFESLAVSKTEAHATGTGTLNGERPYSFTVDVWTVPAAEGRPETPLARVRILDVAKQQPVFDNDVFDGALQAMTGASIRFVAQ
jgi:hypothetical protein